MPIHNQSVVLFAQVGRWASLDVSFVRVASAVSISLTLKLASEWSHHRLRVNHLVLGEAVRISSWLAVGRLNRLLLVLHHSMVSHDIRAAGSRCLWMKHHWLCNYRVEKELWVRHGGIVGPIFYFHKWSRSGSYLVLRVVSPSSAYQSLILLLRGSPFKSACSMCRLGGSRLGFCHLLIQSDLHESNCSCACVSFLFPSHGASLHTIWRTGRWSARGTSHRWRTQL